MHCSQKLLSYNNNEPSIDLGTTQLSPKFNSYNLAADLDFTISLSQANLFESILPVNEIMGEEIKSDQFYGAS